MAKKTGASKKKVVRIEPAGQAHIHSSFNNIIVTITNNSGRLFHGHRQAKWVFKGSKKNTLMRHKWQPRTVVKLHTTLV
jgi:small subunit ribosomal protein S11